MDLKRKCFPNNLFTESNIWKPFKENKLTVLRVKSLNWNLIYKSIPGFKFNGSRIKRSWVSEVMWRAVLVIPRLICFTLKENAEQCSSCVTKELNWLSIIDHERFLRNVWCKIWLKCALVRNIHGHKKGHFFKYLPLVLLGMKAWLWFWSITP